MDPFLFGSRRPFRPDLDDSASDSSSSSSPPRATAERAVVKDFCDKLQALWSQQTNERDFKRLSLATFPFTPTERQALQHATRQGLWEGTLAGLATFAALRGGPWLLTKFLHPSKNNMNMMTASIKKNRFQSPFESSKTVPTSTPTSTTSPHTSSTSTTTATTTSKSNRWMEAGFLFIDSALSFGVAMAVSTQYAPAGDPVIEAIVTMPGLTEMPQQQQAKPAEPSVVIQQVCPLAVDLYKTLQQQQQQQQNQQAGGNILSEKPQTYYLDALQRFVRNCERRLRVEQTSAWQDRNQGNV